MRTCSLCGSTDRETEFDGTRKPRGKSDACRDCTETHDPMEDRIAARRREIAASRRAVMTRASYRAAFRHRQRQPQADMVDMIRGMP